METSNISHGPFVLRLDKNNPNWNREINLVLFFIKHVEQWSNNMLQIRGTLLFNDVLDALRLERTKEGALLGWGNSSQGVVLRTSVVDDAVEITIRPEVEVWSMLPSSSLAESS